jgi:hypothetical protein
MSNFLSRLFPPSCSRLRVFICYAHGDRPLAEELAQALTNDGHEVFVDLKSLKVAADYNEEIRRFIERADRFIFLASKHSLSPQSYPQTELSFAEKRWPSPKGAVWPVIVDPSVDPQSLPIYLRAVQIHAPKGNIVADLASEMEASRTVCLSCLVGAAAALLVAGAVSWVVATGAWQPATFALVPPQQVVFMPEKKPGPEDAWTASRVTLSLLPVNYLNQGSRTFQIVDETVSLPVGEKSISFKWLNEVEMRPNCGFNYLCTKTSVGASTLPAQSTLRRETMYAPAQGASLKWQEFIDFVCRSSADTLDLTLVSDARTNVALEGLFGSSTLQRSTVCRVDLKALRESIKERACVPGPDAVVPIRLSPKCGR